MDALDARPSPAAVQSPPAAGVQITVGTFNIHHGVGAAGDLDLDRTADTIAEIGVDLVGLQEVDRFWAERSLFADQAEHLAERLDMHLAYGASLSRARRDAAQPHGQYGNALLSRYPVLDARNTLLPRRRGGEQRALLSVEIVLDGTALRCLITHLQHRSRAERLNQARAISATVADRNIPTLLMGDLNAKPGAPEIEILTMHLVDTWMSRGEGDGNTYRARAPSARIDYVLTSPSIDVGRARVVTTDASDHLPVTVDLRLPTAASLDRDPSA